jgi:hypothetical protein
MTGLTQADLIIGTYILMSIIGVEMGILIGLAQRAGSVRRLFKLTSKDFHDDDGHTTEHEGKTTEKPQVEKKCVERDHA